MTGATSVRVFAFVRRRRRTPASILTLRRARFIRFGVKAIRAGRPVVRHSKRVFSRQEPTETAVSLCCRALFLSLTISVAPFFSLQQTSVWPSLYGVQDDLSIEEPSAALPPAASLSNLDMPPPYEAVSGGSARRRTQLGHEL